MYTPLELIHLVMSAKGGEANKLVGQRSGCGYTSPAGRVARCPLALLLLLMKPTLFLDPLNPPASGCQYTCRRARFTGFIQRDVNTHTQRSFSPASERHFTSKHSAEMYVDFYFQHKRLRGRRNHQSLSASVQKTKKRACRFVFLQL